MIGTTRCQRRPRRVGLHQRARVARDLTASTRRELLDREPEGSHDREPARPHGQPPGQLVSGEIEGPGGLDLGLTRPSA